MAFIEIDPPGTLCMKEGLRDALRGCAPGTFLDVGCGGGGMSKLLCDAGWRGIGIDFSPQALAAARQRMGDHLAAGHFTLHDGDVLDLPGDFARVDLAISFMVMEHVEDDDGFIRRLAGYVKPMGRLIIGVPGRRDRWSIEDDTVGHLRRYDRSDLERVMHTAGLQRVSVWSIAVPVANLLFNLSVWLIGRSGEMQKRAQTQREQTETSGTRHIPWKTVFPSWVGLLVNRTTLAPLLLLQRRFYGTGLGITMMGFGDVPPDAGAELGHHHPTTRGRTGGGPRRDAAAEQR